MIDFSETEGYSKEKLKQVQNRLFEMAKSTCSILEKNNIPYMIAFGTLLGAVRHKGFIPWDDDFDIFIFDDVYDDAIKCLRKELPDNLFVEDDLSEPLFYHAWARVKDLRSKVDYKAYPQEHVYAHKGLSLDLFRANYMEKKDLEEFINNQNKIYIGKLKSKGLISDSEYNDRIKRLSEDIHRSEKERCTDTTKIYAYPMFYDCKFMYASDVLPLRKYVFEGIEFYGPADAESILKNTYGNYMELPPFEKRKAHYSDVKIYS